jgi:flagellar M-ring protein FliF
LEKMRAIWSGLPAGRRLVAILAAAALAVGLIGMSRLASSPSMTLLYSGLENGAAGDVVAALEARGVAYDVRGGAIFVDSTARDQLRMTLASEGLPANGTDGYELLDNLSGFGTTSQMFDAAYWRAKEGELARTIVTSPAIQTARVHIASQGGRPFRRADAPTASVTITTAAGGIGAAHARALRYLVASAVAGLAPENVSVIDARGGAILAAEDRGAGAAADDRAEALKRNVERLLEARVGYGKAVVEVSIETETDREQITERRIDPDSRVAISQETQETSSTAQDSGGGAVTVASNLPNGDAGAGGDRSQSENSETRERVNYEVSETQREVLRGPGAIRRLSVAVLIDGIRSTDAAGAPVWEPRPEAEMAALRDLVASAVGFDEARGDSLTLKTMEFEPLPQDGSPPASGLLPPLDFDATRLAQIGIVGLVTLLLGLFVLRPILAGSGPAAALPPPLPGRAETGAALTGEIDPQPQPPGPVAIAAGTHSATGGGGSDPVDRLRRMIEERQDESLEVLKSWMEDREETA